jgi:hypothetical protein
LKSWASFFACMHSGSRKTNLIAVKQAAKPSVLM